MRISNGIDLVNINRDEFNNQELINRVLHSNEIKIYQSLDHYNKKRFLAKTWCIKEALFKCYNHQYVMNKIEILYKNNKPYIILDNVFFDISVSYENELVVAIVTAIFD